MGLADAVGSSLRRAVLTETGRASVDFQLAREREQRTEPVQAQVPKQ